MRCPKKTIYHSMSYCISNRLWNLQSETLAKASALAGAGDIKRSKRIYTQLNMINHLAFFLLLSFTQEELNRQSFCIEKYIDPLTLQKIVDKFACDGIDILCLFECFNDYKCCR